VEEKEAEQKANKKNAIGRKFTRNAQNAMGSGHVNIKSSRANAETK
jgi:hypothetical protein